MTKVVPKDISEVVRNTWMFPGFHECIIFLLMPTLFLLPFLNYLLIIFNSLRVKYWIFQILNSFHRHIFKSSNPKLRDTQVIIQVVRRTVTWKFSMYNAIDQFDNVLDWSKTHANVFWKSERVKKQFIKKSSLTFVRFHF